MIKIPHMFVCMSGREGFASNRVAPQEYRLLSLRIVVDEGFFIIAGYLLRVCSRDAMHHKMSADLHWSSAPVHTV